MSHPHAHDPPQRCVPPDRRRTARSRRCPHRLGHADPAIHVGDLLARHGRKRTRRRRMVISPVRRRFPRRRAPPRVRRFRLAPCVNVAPCGYRAVPTRTMRRDGTHRAHHATSGVRRYNGRSRAHPSHGVHGKVRRVQWDTSGMHRNQPAQPQGWIRWTKKDARTGARAPPDTADVCPVHSSAMIASFRNQRNPQRTSTAWHYCKGYVPNNRTTTKDVCETVVKPAHTVCSSEHAAVIAHGVRRRRRGFAMLRNGDRTDTCTGRSVRRCQQPRNPLASSSRRSCTTDRVVHGGGCID